MKYNSFDKKDPFDEDFEDDFTKTPTFYSANACQEDLDDCNEVRAILSKQNKSNATTISELNDALSNLQEKFDKLRKDKRDLDKSLEDCEKEKNNLLKQIKDLEKQLKECKDEKEKLQEKLDNLEKQLKECKDEKEKLEKQLKECKDEKEKLEKQLKDCKDEKEKLEKKLKDCEDECGSKDDLDLGIICKDSAPQIEDQEDWDEVRDWLIKYIECSVPESAKNTVVAKKRKTNKNATYVISDIDEIASVKPSTLLLCRKKMDGLLVKLVQEILMTNFWNGDAANYGFYSAWAMNTLDYSSKGNWGANYRLIPKKKIPGHENDSIIWTRMLMNSEGHLYIDQVYKVIEDYINSHGLACTIKKNFNPSSGKIWNSKKVMVSHGSLPFPSIKPIIKKEGTRKDYYYYIQLSFDIETEEAGFIFPVRGFTILLSSALDLYDIKVGSYKEIDPNTIVTGQGGFDAPTKNFVENSDPWKVNQEDEQEQESMTKVIKKCVTC